ncbi:MAG: DUF131 domain-containing protein [Nanoarchaeota archaeon]
MAAEKIFLIGIIFLFIGIILLFIGGIYSAVKGSTNVKSAGIVFIGPFPIGWASDKTMLYVLIGFVILIFILWITFRRFLF